MTKSIKRNKTFKSKKNKKNKKNKKGGSANNPLLVNSEVEDDIKELFTKLILSECTDVIILNHDDVVYLKKYIGQKETNLTQFEIVLLQKLNLLTNLKSGCKYVFNLNDILQHSNPNLLNTDNYLNNYTFGESYRNNIGNRSPSPRDRGSPSPRDRPSLSLSPSPSPSPRDRGRPSLSPSPSPEPRDRGRGRGRPSLSPDPNYLVPNPFN